MLCNSKLGAVNISVHVFAEAVQAVSAVDTFQQLLKHENENMPFGGIYGWAEALA